MGAVTGAGLDAKGETLVVAHEHRVPKLEVVVIAILSSGRPAGASTWDQKISVLQWHIGA